MAKFLVGNLKEGVSGLITGINLNNVTALDRALSRAAATFIQKGSPPEIMVTEPVILYDGVFDYPINGNIFGGSLLDFRPQGLTRNPWDYAYRQPVELFDRTKAFLPNGFAITFEYVNGTPIMRVASPYPKSRAILDSMNSISGWTAGGGATGLVADETFFYTENASLRFNLSSAGTPGYIEKTLGQQDMTAYQGVGVLFLAFETSDPSNITSIGAHYGSDSSNYYAFSNTTPFVGPLVADGWTVFGLPWAGLIPTGTPDITKMDYLRCIVNYTDGPLSNCRFGGAWVSLPSPADVLYETPNVFNHEGVLSNVITDDSDEILFGDAAYQIYELECAKMVALQMSGGKYTTQIQGFDQMLIGSGPTDMNALYNRYRADNPSEVLRVIDNYYD